jgi:hypothetical protein
MNNCKTLLTAFALIACSIAYSQEGDFPFGKILNAELDMKNYAADTSAGAVVLKEFGRAWITDDYKVLFEYHAKIKILKKTGLKKGNFEIPLFKDEKAGNEQERMLSMEAITFNRNEGKITETPFDTKNLFVEKTTRYLDYAKFALPDVRVGSVIEVKYTTESPYLFQFHTWQFQDDIPKIQSEFWSTIPANIEYSISLRGFLKLTKTDMSLERSCFRASGASERSDCSVGKYVMTNIPSFIEEDFMTAPRNFISAIYYELSQYINAQGVKTKYSEEWKDVDAKLKEHENFGQKIKKARKMMEEIVTPLTASINDPLEKAKTIYNLVKTKYTWNEDNGMYSDADMKAAYEKGQGNAATINFTLIGALQAAGLNADPVLVSTRDHGIPFKLHPQRSDFNYVVSSLKIGEQLYLLDATDSFLPFGVLPMRCLNDQGRLVSKDESTWVDLKASQKKRSSVAMEMKLTEEGTLKGKVTFQYFGYAAIAQRKQIYGSANQEEYVKTLSSKWSDAVIQNYQVENKEDLSKPLIEKMEMEFTGLDNGASQILYFNPFLSDRYESNPFKSSERLYPVDLGAPLESTYFISIELPEKYMVDELPSNMAMSLPQGGGKCLLNINQSANKITLTSILSLAKPIYDSQEYHNLKEFFARVVQMQQSQFVFKAK